MNITKKLQHKYALSKQGAKDMIKASICVMLSDLMLMLPAGLLFTLIGDLISGNLSYSKERILFYAAGTVATLLLMGITQWFQYDACFLTTYKESGVRRTLIAECLRKLPLSYFGKKNLTDLTTNILGDCSKIETASSHWIPELYGALLSTTLIGISLFAMFDWRLVLACFWVIPIALLIVFTSSGFQKRAVRKNAAIKLELQDGIQECLETLRDLRSNNAEDRYMEGLKKKIKKVEKQAFLTELAMAVYVSSAQMLIKVGIATTSLVGGTLLALGEINVLTFFMFMMIVSRLYDPMQVSLQNFAAIIGTDIQCERLEEILSHPLQKGNEELTNKGFDIVFENVHFAYNNGVDVLKDVNFTAKQGEVTALIGPSGGGKTTVSRLAARFWDITEGKITVGGTDISKIDPEKLLSMFSIVFQDVILFNNTVMENIRIGKKDASDEEVLKAARLANCDEFIAKLPDGYNTVIGENGKNLSGGERQRISIARAFLKDAPVILLDEATASLDVENETLIQESISSLIKDKTVLIIAHRMRTVTNANKIVVLKDGVVAEQGSPSELLEKDSIFKHMKEMQMESSKWNLH